MGLIPVSDFPGDGLIKAIINLNPWHVPPVADAGRPYTADEGSVITFTAAGSSDPDGDTLAHRWDFDTDGNWDTSWSSSPTAEHTWPDDHTGFVTVEVGDGRHSTTASAPVTVQNVAPTILSTRLTDGYGTEVGTGVGLVLTSVPLHVNANFLDVAALDTRTAPVDWDDGAPEGLGATNGAVSATHAYAQPGVYTGTLWVTDDDCGVGKVTKSVTVVDAKAALDSVMQSLQGLPSTLGPAGHALDKALTALGGGASSGAIGLLDLGARNAALDAIVRSIQDIRDYEALTGKGLADLKALLTLAAKSVAAAAVQEADAAAANDSQHASVASAKTLSANGDSLLASKSYADSVSACQDAVIAVQGIA